MTARTLGLHRAFLDALDGRVLAHGDPGRKPLDLELAPPLPSALRLYIYTLVAGGPSRTSEYKAVVRVPGQEPGQYGGFDHVDGRLTLLVAHRADLDVFVLWDASLHRRFKWAGNIQVHADTVLAAAATGWAEQRRPLTSGVTEVVFACQGRNLPRALTERVSWTGGVRDA